MKRNALEKIESKIEYFYTWKIWYEKRYKEAKRQKQKILINMDKEGIK